MFVKRFENDIYVGENARKWQRLYSNLEDM